MKVNPVLVFLLLLVSSAYADSYTVSDGFTTILKFLGGLMFGFMDSGDVIVSILLILFAFLVFVGVVLLGLSLIFAVFKVISK